MTSPPSCARNLRFTRLSPQVERELSSPPTLSTDGEGAFLRRQDIFPQLIFPLSIKFLQQQILYNIVTVRKKK